MDSIHVIHEWFGLGKPGHSLITLFNYEDIRRKVSFAGKTLVNSLYYIALKKIPEGAYIQYGRQAYDFQEGSMMFMAPGQTFHTERDEEDAIGWALVFHPDLIRHGNLGLKINDYTFFSYAVHEALHLSEKEKQSVGRIVETIQAEYNANLDNHSHTLIISNLELLLNYCDRFYSRQFITREAVNHDVISQFERYLKEYFDSDKPMERGVPSVKQCARAMNYSPNYLSDLLRKETGRGTLEHIHSFLIERAKTLLLASNDSVNEIARRLGFEYPNHFSRLFKKQTGETPASYRRVS